MKKCRYERLHREVVHYLEFSDLARERDTLWDEYCAWKRITDSRFTLQEKLKLYTMRK